jgi:hypothetical protein
MEPEAVHEILRRFKGVLIALVALAMSASLVFGAQAPAAGYALGSSFHAGTAGLGNDEDGNEDVDEAEDTETDEDTDEGDSADNCLTDPTGLSAEELAAMSHGSIVCWAAHQETPDGYANHGAWVSHWAHMGKGNDASTTGKTKGQGNGKGKGLANRP